MIFTHFSIAKVQHNSSHALQHIYIRHILWYYTYVTEEIP